MRNTAIDGLLGRPRRAAAVILAMTVRALLLLAVFHGALLAETSVQSDRWLADAKYLSSDRLKGRGNNTPELDEAAVYIAEQFRKAGLEVLPEGAFQPFEANVGAELGTDNRLALLSPSARSYRIRQHFIPLSMSGSGERSGALAFVGYGITAPEYGYDDYDGIDVERKVVVVLRHEPQETDESSVFSGRRFTRHASLVNKAINARNHGAVAMLLVNDPLYHKGEEDRLVRFGRGGGPSDLGVLAVHVKRAVVEQLMDEAGKSLLELQEAIDGDLTPRSSFLPDNFQVKIRADVRHRKRMLKNVAAFLPGSDPVLRDEVIVIGAHYDHLGLGEQNSLVPRQAGQIHNGADDNASGTAGLLELARTFGEERGQLRRSLLLLAFAGEELGLLGSAHYVEEPLVPLGRTIAMLNLDMIGRVKQNKLYIGGVGTSPGFRQLVEQENVEQENRDAAFQIEFSDTGYDASDHVSFNRKQVPVMFFFSGLHSDYHKPSDTWEKLEPENTARVLELVSRVVRKIDSEDERPQFTQVRRSRRARGGAGDETGYGPYFGSIPDFGESDKGVKFADVREGSPAAQAGLQAGDILVEFDGNELLNLYDFTYALRGKSPGDEVLVVVLRGDQQVRAVVKLGIRE